MKAGTDLVSDLISTIKKNICYIISIIATVIVLLYLHDLGQRKRNIEGYDNENALHPSNIKESLQLLKEKNDLIKDDLHIEKYRKQYEDYLIELYDHINIVALDQCVKPEKNIEKKMTNLKTYDTRYTPLKQMINESMKTLNDTKEVKSK
jgi:hypothetical protein